MHRTGSPPHPTRRYNAYSPHDPRVVVAQEREARDVARQRATASWNGSVTAIPPTAQQFDVSVDD